MIMQGHIRKRGKQSWAVVLSLGRDPQTGKKKQKWYGQLRSRREAQQKLAQLFVDVQSRTWTPPTKQITGEFLERWLADYAKGACGPVTFTGYQAIVRR
jgi:Arm domain-containing DNA-binding protein